MASAEPTSGSTQVDTSIPDRVESPGAAAMPMATKIGRFAILERIGVGGMGEVYAAYDAQLDRKIALKVIHRERVGSSRAQARLLREAQALARLSHPHVVTVFEAGVHEGGVFIAMEYIRGQTLRRWLEQAPRSWAEILAVFVQVGEGLAAVHDLGLIHRDLKPDNVLVDERGRPRLIDFGLVRHLERIPDDDVSEAAEGLGMEAGGLGSLTRTGALIGTPMYMSPEQFGREPLGPTCDQFSFCVALYEAVYGHLPFDGATPQERAVAVLKGELEAPAPGIDVPGELFAVLGRGLRREPAARWPGMNALLNALRGLLASYDPELEDVAAHRARRKVMITLLTVVLAVLSGFALFTSTGSFAMSSTSVVTLDFVMMVVVGGLTALSRSRWSNGRRSRRIVWLFLLAVTLIFVQDAVGYAIGRPLYFSVVSNAVSIALICLFAAPLTSHAMWWSGLWVGLWTLVMVIDREHFFVYFNAGVIGAAAINIAIFPRRTVDRWIRMAASQGSESVGTRTRTTEERQEP